jgi:hypothetical protein
LDTRNRKARPFRRLHFTAKVSLRPTGNFRFFRHLRRCSAHAPNRQKILQKAIAFSKTRH